MQPRTFIPFIASLTLMASAALAQDAQPAPAAPMAHHGQWMDKGDFAKHHAEMCTDRYARAVGKLAYLETKLALSNVQKPLFDHWKSVKLAGIKARTADCANFKMPDKDASLADHLNRQTAMLESRLAELKAQTPALEALAASLTQEQQATFEHAAREMHRARAGMMGGMREMHEHRMGMHHDGGPDAPPPPPPAQ